MKRSIILMGFLTFAMLSNAQKFGGDDSDGVKKAKGSKKYDFKVTYVNGSTKTFKSTIDINYCMRTMFLEIKDEEIAVYPPETQFIECITKDGSSFKGTPMDSFWVFQQIEGKVNTYSVIPEKKLKYAEFLKKGDDPMHDFSKETVRIAVSDNKEALELIDGNEKSQKLSKKMNITGGVALFLGLFTGEKMGVDVRKFKDTNGDGKNDNAFVVSYLHFAGIGLIGTGIAIKHLSRNNVKKAIEIYNK